MESFILPEENIKEKFSHILTQKYLKKPLNIEKIDIYVLPVSGGRFASQLGLLAELYKSKKTKYYPDLVLASSGGNACAYLGLAADWSSKRIENLAYMLNSSMFISSWVPPPLNEMIPSWIYVFKSSLYNHGSGILELFKNIFTPKTISRTEIWTGSYDLNSNKTQFFCNKKETLLDINSFNQNAFLYGSMPLKTLDGDIEAIAKVCQASAAIPKVCPPVFIGDKKYCDGGISYSSPLSALSNEIYSLIYENNLSLRLTYFCPYHMDSNILRHEGIFIHLSSFLYNDILQDRREAINLIYKLVPKNKVRYLSYHHCDSKLLSEVLSLVEDKKHYILVIYPHGNIYVNLRNFSGKDIINVMRKTRENYGIHLWYSSKD